MCFSSVSEHLSTGVWAVRLGLLSLAGSRSVSTEEESPAARSHSRDSITALTRSDNSAVSGVHPADAGAARRARSGGGKEGKRSGA